MEARSSPRNCRRSHQFLIGLYAAAPTISSATATQAPTIANDLRRSARDCLRRTSSATARREDLSFLSKLVATNSGFRGGGQKGPMLGRRGESTEFRRGTGGGWPNRCDPRRRVRTGSSSQPWTNATAPIRSREPPETVTCEGESTAMATSVCASVSASVSSALASAAVSSAASTGTPNGTPNATGSPPRAAATTASRAPYPNRSAPSSRISAAAPGPSSSGWSTRSGRPRTTAKGRPETLPCASSAAPASSSATAISVTDNRLP